MEQIIEYAVKLVFAILSVVVATYVVPWLKEKKLYNTIVQLVQAAEKLSENIEIDKKEYVIKILESKGIKVNAYVDALIEACVLELDAALGNVKHKETNE